MKIIICFSVVSVLTAELTFEHTWDDMETGMKLGT